MAEYKVLPPRRVVWASVPGYGVQNIEVQVYTQDDYVFMVPIYVLTGAPASLPLRYTLEQARILLSALGATIAELTVQPSLK